MVEKYRPVWEQFFRDADRNNDGRLSWTELKDVFLLYGYKGDMDCIREIFDDMDLNHDEYVTMDEYNKAMETRPAEFHKQTYYRRTFLEADTDGDGRLSPEELQEALDICGIRLPEEELQDMMKGADSEGCGNLSIDDFLEALSQP